MWTPKRILVSSAGAVRELTFQDTSIEDTLGVVVFLSAFESDVFAGLVIWTPRRVLMASPDGTVDELTFQGESIANTLGVLLGVLIQHPAAESEAGVGLVIWTTDRVLTISGGVVSQLSFNGEAIRSKVRIPQWPFRQQTESFSTSPYEAEAYLHGSCGALLLTNPLLETFFPPQ